MKFKILALFTLHSYNKPRTFFTLLIFSRPNDDFIRKPRKKRREGEKEKKRKRGHVQCWYMEKRGKRIRHGRAVSGSEWLVRNGTP